MTTTNFKDKEFACPCCGQTKVDPLLRLSLEELRALLRNKYPRTFKGIRINSGYRCAAHNKKVRGSKNSQHMLGKAADVVGLLKDGEVPPQEVWEAARLVHHFVLGGIGRYKTFVHVDVRGKKARWVAE